MSRPPSGRWDAGAQPTPSRSFAAICTSAFRAPGSARIPNTALSPSSAARGAKAEDTSDCAYSPATRLNAKRLKFISPLRQHARIRIEPSAVSVNRSLKHVRSQTAGSFSSTGNAEPLAKRRNRTGDSAACRSEDVIDYWTGNRAKHRGRDSAENAALRRITSPLA